MRDEEARSKIRYEAKKDQRGEVAGRLDFVFLVDGVHDLLDIHVS